MRSRMLWAFVLLPLAVMTPSVVHGQAEGWWRHMTVLADDSLLGRQTGSRGERMAAEYVAEQFRRVGLEPAGIDGYLQPVSFVSRTIDESRSRLTLVRADGTTEELKLGPDAYVSLRFSRGGRVEAPLVFVGYGLVVPDKGYDDLARLDLRGKVAVLITGGPPSIPGPLLAHHQAERWEPLRRAGAVGAITIQQPRFRDGPWERATAQRLLPAMALADSALMDPTLSIAAALNATRADALFAGAGYTIAELLAIADSGKSLPRFPIPAKLHAEITIVTEAVESRNVVGLLRGRDPRLAREYVVVSAHHDHVGVGRVVDGDSIYNGAMDDASGVATVLETALAMARGPVPRRSVLFSVFTAEEKGLLGSRHFARRPTVPRDAIVADLNVDFAPPLFPLRAVTALGDQESDLGDDVRRIAKARGIPVLPDWEPQRNAFIRADHYSFIREGVPALALSVGIERDSPEHRIARRWLAERYHAPSDDLAQPLDRQAADDFNQFFLDVVRAVADRPTRPRWNVDSFFRRFAEKSK